ncbi:MAG: sodium:solute symporter family protein [Pirellulaceae bacterium]|nr:sodium:solute symporter family protein [Pirellulaceae bacterium]
MNDHLIPFSITEMSFIGLYLLSLLAVGYFGYRARRENTLKDFYLGGQGVGVVVLLLTLYATQYSGNTLFGFSGETYRSGFSWAVSIHFMTAIVVVYLLFAPQLHALSRQHQFITPSDYIHHRFGSPLLSLCASVLMVVAIANYLLAQLMAMGSALEGLTTAAPWQAYTWGVIVLALVIVIYETLGGFRAVAWTDAIQGSVLLAGFGILLFMVFREFGTLGDATRQLAADDPQILAPPTGDAVRRWFSYVLLVGIGGALYPQAIQRVYCARSATALRRSLAIMAFLPLTTTLVALIVGIMGRAHVGDLVVDGIDRSDTILTVICRHIQESSTLGRWLVVVLFAGILAAIMSTADSVLLSISSMLTKDIYARHLRPSAAESELTRLGKLCSWVLIVVLVTLAIVLRGTKLVDLLDRKFDLLAQLGPAFILGINWPRMRAGPTLAGLLVGVAIALGMVIAGYSRLWGIHPGLFGLAANLLIVVVGSLWPVQSRQSS